MIIWLASYPRSGNTYFRSLLKHYYDISTYSVYDDKPLAERKVIWDIVGHKTRTLTLDEMKISEDVFFVKTHDLPEDEAPAIYLVRDGRDALVSYAHYILSFEEADAAKNEQKSYINHLQNLIEFQYSFSGWGPNVTAWHKRVAPTCIVKFEHLVTARNPFTIVADALKQVSFAKTSTKSSVKPPSFKVLNKKMPNFFRKGKIGGWKDEMPKELHQLFWREYGEAMTLAGYEKQGWI